MASPLRLEKFIRRKAFDLILFGHVRGLVMSFTSISQVDAIKNFCSNYNIDDDEKTINSYLKTYQRMVRELMEFEKSK